MGMAPAPDDMNNKAWKSGSASNHTTGGPRFISRDLGRRAEEEVAEKWRVRSLVSSSSLRQEQSGMAADALTNLIQGLRCLRLQGCHEVR
jgi:hypothetical protein